MSIYTLIDGTSKHNSFRLIKGGGAKVYVGPGDVEKAFSWLNEAVDSPEYDTFSTRWWNFEFDPSATTLDSTTCCGG